jgi:homoserine O-succinyltransferase
VFTCPEIPRSADPVDGAGNRYADIADLFESPADSAPVDALIVTGMEPQAVALQDEPVWGKLAGLVDWAQANRVPVIWSCLAAHAAVLHLDGIVRSRLSRKLLGLFDCDILDIDHALAAGLPERWTTPHSRYHDLSQPALVANGYQVLSSSGEAGVDVFLKHDGAPFLFFQGHPEYEADTLLRQFRRDVRRYLVGESEEYPSAPRNSFDTATEAALDEARNRALKHQLDAAELEPILAFANAAASAIRWEHPAVGLAANWLRLVAQEGGCWNRRRAWSNQVPLMQPSEDRAGLAR